LELSPTFGNKDPLRANKPLVGLVRGGGVPSRYPDVEPMELGGRPEYADVAGIEGGVYTRDDGNVMVREDEDGMALLS
jgi:hypothetical protein